MKYFTLLFIAISFLFSCSTSKESINTEVSVTTLQKGVLYGAGDEGFQQSVRKIHSIEEWHSLVKELGKVNVFETNFDAHTFDFENNSLYFCTDQVRSSGGYSLSVSNGKIVKNNVFVAVTIHSPQDVAAEVLTQPYILFSMERKDKVEIQFVEE